MLSDIFDSLTVKSSDTAIGFEAEPYGRLTDINKLLPVFF